MNVLAVLFILLVAKVFIYKIFFRGEVCAALERDPAALGPVTVILTYPGVHAIAHYRIANFFHKLGFKFFARAISQFARWITGVEIHPGATIGKGLFIDHGMGVVIGETAVLGENVTLFQGVTLGGTGKEKGKRHPTLGDNVVIGAGASVLGNIHVGDNVQVGSNAVVVRDVPSNSTVVGVPGRITSRQGKRIPGINLDHTSLPDPLTQALEKLQHEIDHIEHELKDFHADDKKQKSGH